MASDDRTFEKALARHLRSAAPQEATAQQPACADAETLAAYHERLLALGDLNAWKEHIAGCPRCQEILTQLEATDEIPVAAGDAILVEPVLVTRPSALPAVASAAGSPTAVAPATVVAISPPATKKPRPISRATWRWIAPAGAIAAALLVWVVWHEDRLNSDRLQKSVLQPSATVAENRRSDSIPAAASSNPGVPADSGRSEPKTLPSPSLRIPAPAEAGTRARELDRDESLSDLRKPSPQKDYFRAKGQVGPSNRALQQQANSATQQFGVGAAGDLKQDASSFDSTDKLSAAPSPVPPPALNRAVLAPAVSGGAAQGFMKKKEQAADAAPEALGQVAETVAVTGQASALQSTTTSVNLVATPGRRVIPVPGSRVIWKIEDDGRVRRTTNLGDSWQSQDVGVHTALLSGSAPSEKVCWLVGNFGTVVLTTDGGAHWTAHSLPVSLPIDRITAVDALHAVVALQSTNIQYETSDAGQTWFRLTKK